MRGPSRVWIEMMGKWEGGVREAPPGPGQTVAQHFSGNGEPRKVFERGSDLMSHLSGEEMSRVRWRQEEEQEGTLGDLDRPWPLGRRKWATCKDCLQQKEELREQGTDWRKTEEEEG